jgi:hypothetical protein
MQLDIFEHSRDVMLRNDALQALERRDPIAARGAWQALAAEYPQDPNLPPLDLLATTLEHPDSGTFTAHATAGEALGRLRHAIEPAARHLFGDQAGAAWLVPLWRQLAQRMARLEFETGFSEVHAAPLWLRASDYAAAAEAAASIPSWRRIPAPLAWMTEARLRIDGLDASWGLLAELAWLTPGRFDELTKRLADPVLRQMRRLFDAAFEGDGGLADLAWFPAWALIEKPALAALLGRA